LQDARAQREPLGGGDCEAGAWGLARGASRGAREVERV